MVDLAIVGSGPSALSAAIYAAREGLTVQIFEKSIIGGLVANTDFLENFPGFENGISGFELSKKMRFQAEKFGVKIDYGEVYSVEDIGEKVQLKVDDSIFEAKTALIATGNSYKKLNLPREDEFLGRGIHFCATCDGALYAQKNLIAVGGGNSAVQEAIFLSRHAKKVTLLVRSEIKAQDFLVKKLRQIEAKGKIEVIQGAEISEILTSKTNFGEKIVGVKVRKGDQTFELPTDGIFEFIGLIPNTDFLKKTKIQLSKSGEIIVNDKLQTNQPRIFACGDVLENSQKQAIIAAASGAKAGIEIAEFMVEQ